jgi:hypothetical protein
MKLEIHRSNYLHHKHIQEHQYHPHFDELRTFQGIQSMKKRLRTIKKKVA